MADISTLLNLVPDAPHHVLTHLTSHPDLASARDSHGYSLLHAAASYNQLPLLRELVNTYNAPVDILDEDGETPLFSVETVEAARCLVEELGADTGVRNLEGLTAEERIEGEGEWVLVGAYLRDVEGSANGGAASGANGDGLRHPPPLPNGLKINMNTVSEEEAGMDQEGADPEFRRRIEELAAREDFQTEAGQAELRALVREAVGGLAGEGQGREVRRRVE
ncbi:hypothetical protein K490DRAFT_38061 [Saccharata proteae CBS 121410]|uniref:Uncharacterized protein n=1 Tax=Saccharata proteae CBS 121410 TaxID=1314787 RepID=A0A6A5YD41_9PEZI|nr:hypothetical protein K490DRAFT_38061 [Saccharata proteae CBS 121410]